MIRHSPRARRRTLLTGATAAAALGASAACGDDGPAGTADDPVTIGFEWWGDEARAEITQQAVDLFEQKNEGIKVRASFADYPVYWEGLTTRMVSQDLPDVFQMDYPRLRQFATNGMLLPLEGVVDTSDFREGLLDTGKIDDELIAVPVAANHLGLIYRADWYAEHGIDAPQPGHTWEEYGETIRTLTAALGEGKWGAEDWARSYLFLEMWLYQQGASFYTEDSASLGFTKDQLLAWWETSAPHIEAGDIPTFEEASSWTADGMVEDTLASEIRWDSAVTGLWPAVEEAGGQLALAAPPTSDPNNLGIYRKPSMQFVIAANSENAEASAKLIEFCLTDPEAIAILGTNRGIPATNVGLESVELDEASQAILDYEESVAEYVAPSPPAPPAAAGAIEAKYTEIYEQVQYAELTPEAAADLFFEEAATLFASEE
ncbi:ABC transporter substrate-binding protein [Glycomyces buryatensis]|uniref:Extracellular solute-binding protein n=1 Tax=Glycomyces buryatensis TaxID=2570927 RepID=A0A4S8QDU6_9ACTN|nr:extracellular solute-binding protein [Glycomyces buryatensis]THV42490.1 extracellular solute-binding protein [Glycomyces buryatensis]